MNADEERRRKLLGGKERLTTKNTYQIIECMFFSELHVMNGSLELSKKCHAI
jgi:hypothetical protein